MKDLENYMIVIGNIIFEEILNNQYNGIGKLYENNILIYEGEFKNNKKHGN